MQKEIVAAIAVYLASEMHVRTLSDSTIFITSKEFDSGVDAIKSIATEIAAAIAPLVEEGEPRFYNPTEHPTRVEGEDFSVDVFILDEDCVHGIAFWNFDDEVWRFHTDTLVDYNEKGAETKWKWYYPPFELSEVFKAK